MSRGKSASKHASMPSGVSCPMTAVAARCNAYWLHQAARAALEVPTVASKGVITSRRPLSIACCTGGGKGPGNPCAKIQTMGIRPARHVLETARSSGERSSEITPTGRWGHLAGRNIFRPDCHSAGRGAGCQKGGQGQVQQGAVADEKPRAAKAQPIPIGRVFADISPDIGQGPRIPDDDVVVVASPR